MLIGGIQTLSLLDYPGKISAIVFTAGCNFRCGFCHNPHLVDSEQLRAMASYFIPEEKIFRFLRLRKNFIDGVVVSGGEPTIQPDLIPFIEKIKALSLLVKLDTNGSHPQTVKTLLEKNLVDYIAMDIKASPQNLKKICRPVRNLCIEEKIKRSRDLILQSKIDYEFRTTVISPLHDSSEIKKIAQFCQGAKRYTIQNFRPEKTLDKTYRSYCGFSSQKLQRFKSIAQRYIEDVVVLEN